MAIVEKGDKIPEFKVEDQNGEEISFENSEKKLMLSFHPLAWTPLCTDQMRDLENRYDEFVEKGVIPVGLSVDAGPTKGVWAKGLALEKLSIIPDFNPFGKIAKDCGIFLEDMNTSGRANVIVDETGQVLWSKNYDLGERPDLDEVLQAIENL